MEYVGTDDVSKSPRSRFMTKCTAALNASFDWSERRKIDGEWRRMRKKGSNQKCKMDTTSVLALELWHRKFLHVCDVHRPVGVGRALSLYADAIKYVLRLQMSLIELIFQLWIESIHDTLKKYFRKSKIETSLTKGNSYDLIHSSCALNTLFSFSVFLALLKNYIKRIQIYWKLLFRRHGKRFNERTQFNELREKQGSERKKMKWTSVNTPSNDWKTCAQSHFIVQPFTANVNEHRRQGLEQK